ncbi:nicotinate-nucleotide--dimethylbenzimidazole phosphoribosyltransferase [Streptomyces griseoviridis]|uniref:Nicotinate-nucleotide--dimethylbenzimidazole phosphoribosyltransferase n=1 Tax=Streptomyces griseoviridis TaxID=45398 RepID=A0ABT9LAL4_STRGD|nr:nicotinate-nucleotide--dimethylbenzimidazole phosphoribosyltransferase [Streptomyces griseoviridis]MDP9680756.1 nicotinate-nucleotide--dimethylbenzimidazole phosphoribosyltransferase [Streptomyces griseoviridis]GGS97853.1 hypothetical protein GCM10010240_34000 [Streptomyces griseoviridis]
MTDTGQIPEGLPENAGMVEHPGVPAPGAYAYLSETTAEDEDLLLLPGAQSAWGNEVAPPAPEPVVEAVHEPEPHEISGRDSGAFDLGAVRTAAPAAPRRPLHLGPPLPDTSASPVRSLADRGPAHPAARPAGSPAPGPEAPQAATPWAAQPPAQAQTAPEADPAETVVPADVPESGAQTGTVPDAAAPEGAVPESAVPATEAAAEPRTPEPVAVPEAQEQQPPVPAVGTPVVAEEPVAAPQEHAGPAAAVEVPGPAGAEPEAGAEAFEAPAPVETPAPQAAEAPEAPAVPVAVAEAPVAEAPVAEVPVAQVPGVEETEASGAEAAPEPAADPAGEPAAEPAVALAEQAPATEPAAGAVPAPTSEAAAPEAAPALPPEAAAPEAVSAPDPLPEVPAPAAVDAVPALPDAVPAQPDVVPAPSFGDPAAPVASEQPVAPEAPAAEAPAASEVPVAAEAPAAAEAPVAPEAPAVAEVPEAPVTPVAPEAPAVVAGPPEVPQAPAAPQTPPVTGAPGVPDVPATPEPVEHIEPAALAAPVEEPFARTAPEAPLAPPAPERPALAEEPSRPAPVEPAPQPTPPASVPVPPAQPAQAPQPQAPVPGPQFVQEQHTVEGAPQSAQEQEAVAVVPQPAQGPQSAVSGTDLPAAPQHLAEAEPQAAPPAATVPAPREGDPEPAAAGPVPAQSADDLDTRAAEQEDREEAARRSTGPAAPPYDDAEREAVLKVMRERRDIRNGFRGDPIPHEVLLRVLEAAHTAPSVGHSQPWDFVVIRSADTRRAMHELAERQREAYAKSLPKGRAKQFRELKIEAILDTPVNIVVTADPTRGGRHTLGRHTQPQMAPYSSALAVENLWLAARAEGLGVGWVSFFDEREMVRALGLPEHLEVVAYLCVGYVDEFPDEPELMQAGWSKRRPLSWVVHEETYGRRALPGEDPHDLLAETVAQIRPLDAKALGEAWERQKRMTKPAGALGMLEIISAQLSGLSRQCPPPIPEPAAVAVFAGDHGVHAQGVTPWPQEVTAQMVANFLGGGAVCNAFATQVGAEVCVVDVGVAADLPATPGLLPRKVRPGTADMTTGPALTREEVKQAIEVGIETARDLVAAGNKALLTGEMGIANTTASAALISVFTGADPAEVTGRGTGINDETLARKTEVVRRALELHRPDPADPIGVLAAVGGLEHAAMVGLLLGGASLRTPVILDGVSAGAAALVARAIAPEVLAACIAGHRSAEPGHVAALNKLGLRPLVDLDLRLGEGTGALLALPMVQSTARAMHEVATFDSAGVTEK